MSLGPISSVLVCAFCFGLGWAVVTLADLRVSAESRLVLASGSGLIFGAWLLYGSAVAWGRLGPESVITVALAVLALMFVAFKKPDGQPWRPEPWFIALVVFVGAVIAWMNWYGVLANLPDGGVGAVEHVWADTPFHGSIVSGLAFRPDYPPHYTIALGRSLGYPFMVDLLSAVPLRFGASFRTSLIAVNIPVAVTIFAGVAAITRRVTGSARAAVIATLVFLCLGNFGFLSVASDIHEAGGFTNWAKHLPWSYTGDAFGGKGRDRLGSGIYLGNPTFMFILPRRSGAFGLAGLVTGLTALDALADRTRLRTAILVGLLLGAMPRVHGHTSIALAVIAITWFFMRTRRKQDDSLPVWLIGGGLAGLLALPQFLGIRSQTSGFTSVVLGWTGESHQAVVDFLSGAHPLQAAFSFLTFWVLNGGLLLLLLPLALIRADRNVRRWYLPFGFIWLLGMLVRTQPLEWDNSNWFVIWQLATVILVSSLLASTPRSIGLQLRLRTAAVVVSLILLTAGGFLSFTYAAQGRMYLWSTAEISASAQIRKHTPDTAVILTAGADPHSHPVNALSGRQVYSGWGGWLLAHGLDWASYGAGQKAMFSGDVALMREEGVTYVLRSPYENGYATTHQLDLKFLDGPDFTEVWQSDVNGQDWALYRLNRLK